MFEEVFSPRYRYEYVYSYPPSNFPIFYAIYIPKGRPLQDFRNISAKHAFRLPALPHPISEPSPRPSSSRNPTVRIQYSVKCILPTNISISRNNVSSPSTFSATPLFQVATQASYTGEVQEAATSSPTETSLFHTVSPFATSTAYPATSAAVTSMGVPTVSKNSVAGRSQVPLGAAAVLGLVVGLVTVM